MMRKGIFILLPCLAALVLLGCLAAPAGAAIIGNKLAVTGNGCWFPDVAYNSVGQKYLVVWSDYNYSPIQIRGQFVDGNGAFSGGQFAISSTYSSMHPNIAYNSTNDEFLVAWINGANDFVYGRRVRGSDGALLGSEFLISSAVASNLGVAWSSGSNCYIAVFYAGIAGCDIRAQRISNTGALLGGEVNVSNDSDYSGYPTVSYGSSGNQFLATWDTEDAGGITNIRARRIDAATGSLLGSVINVTSGNCKGRACSAYDSVNNRWMVQYNDCSVGGHSYDQGAQIVGTDGSLIGSNFFIASTSVLEGDPQGGGDISYVPGYQKFLASYTWDTNNAGQEINPSGTLIGGAVNMSSNTPPYEVYGVANAADTTLNRFLAVWNNFDGSSVCVQARLYGATLGSPLGPVSSFVATPGNAQNVLSWHNPSESQFTSTMIRFKTTGYPTSTTDGTLVVDKANSPNTNDSYTHLSLTNEVIYYYTAFAHDSVPTYATGVSAQATPSAHPGLTIIPAPQQLTWKTGTGFLVNSSTQIMANSNPDSKEQNTANQLARKVWDMTGYLPTIVYGGSTTSNVIAIGDPARCPAVSSIIATWSDATGKVSKTEGYMIGVKDTSIVIRGYDNAGTFYGCQTLIQLLECYKTTQIETLFVYDYPDLPLRGSDWRVVFNHDWAFTKELVSEMMARYKLNVICVRDDDGTQWESHPELPVNDPTNAVPKSAYVDLLNFGGLHYMAPWPWTGTGWSNTSEYATKGTLHSDLRECTTDPENDPAESFCPLLPAAQTLVRDLELEELAYCPNALFLGSGHSEYRDLRWSGCPRCTQYPDNASLLNQFIWNDYNWNAAHGKETAMFGDMLRGDGNQPGAPQNWNTWSCITTIPDPIIVVDWEYGSPGNVPTDYPTIDYWLSNGLSCIGMPYGFGSMPQYNQNYGDKENIYYWATALKARLASYPTKIRGLIAFNKYVAYDKQVVLNSDLSRQMLGCFPYYGAWSWHVGTPNWNPYPYGNGWEMVARELSPDRVSSFLAARNGSNVNLTWTNPPESKFQAAYIVYRTDRQPTSPIDGTYLADVAGSPSAAGSYTHVSAPSVVYYGVFAHDNVRHFSPAASAQIGGYCFEDHFSYSNGSLNGNGGWSGTASSDQIAINGQCVQLNGGAGGFDAIKTVSCGDAGTGHITVTIKINGEIGTLTSWNLWIDDSSARNFARWYGSGTTARGRIGGTGIVTASQNLTGGWDTLQVKIYPSANNTEFFFNGVSLGTYSHASEGTADIVGRLRFERIDASSAVGQYLYFDDLTIGDTPTDTTPPGPVTGFTAIGGDMQNTLSWTKPGDTDLAGVKIMFKTTGYPTSQADGTQCYSGTGTSTVHTGLTNGTTYYYAAYAFDGVPNYSAAAQASGVPTDTIAPGNVTAFTATPSSGQNVLAWTKPGDADLAGVKIMFKTTGYPTGPTDGTQCYSGNGTTTTHSGLTDGTTYYYAAFSFDEVPNYSAGATASGTPTATFCWEDNINYSNGALNGNGGWSGSATSAHIEVIDSKIRMWGGATSYDAVKTVSCSDTGQGYIMVRCDAYAGTGTSTMWNLWINDSAGKNFCRWYGSGTTARGRIGGTGLVTATQTLRGGGLWDSLVVKIIPSAKTSEFFFNGASLGVLSYASEGTGNTISQVRFARENNSGASGNTVYLDRPRVGG